MTKPFMEKLSICNYGCIGELELKLMRATRELVVEFAERPGLSVMTATVREADIGSLPRDAGLLAGWLTRASGALSRPNT